MKKLDLLITILISALCIVSCQKTIDTPENKSSLLVGKNWKLTTYTSLDVTGSTDLYGYILPCDIDNFQVFSANGKYKVDVGVIKCNANDPQVRETGTWEVKDNMLTTLEDGTSYQYKATILELNDKTFKMSIPNPVAAGTVFFTFTAQ